MKKADPNLNANRNIMKVTYVILAIFLALIASVVYFLQVEREDVINNSYNTRLDSFSDRILRGKILSSDGQVLAETQTDEDGNETRVYPFGSLFAHVVGHSSVGKTGLESLGNFYLLSSHVNLLEQIVKEISGQKNLGDNIITTLDVELQQAAYEALGDRNGAVIALDPDTGKILAMVSKPDYDPNPASLSEAWADLVSSDNMEGQLLNRATQGLYPPGSVFKIVTALEAIEEYPDNYLDYMYDCSGILYVDDYSIRCYHSTAHGSQNLAQAFANSCNGAFANLGLNLDLDKMYSLAERLLFNSQLPLGMSYSQSAYNMTGESDEWEILQTSIGQGTTQVTPMHIAMITSAISNGGTLMRPYVMDSVQSAAGEEVRKFLPEAYGSLMTADEAEKLNELMTLVVTEGTGSALRDASYQAAGKTGSAEFETGKETHAWFTGYAPAEDPRIVVTVIVEEGGSGGSTAAPVARQIFDLYLSR